MFANGFEPKAPNLLKSVAIDLQIAVSTKGRGESRWGQNDLTPIELYALLFFSIEKIERRLNMTLEEVVYQVEGQLAVEEIEESVQLSLLDNIKYVCVISFRDNKPNIDARVTGKTLEEARQNLVDILKGSFLIHSFPIQWTSYNQTLRIPDTLTE